MRLVFLAVVVALSAAGCERREPKNYGSATAQVLCMSFGGLAREAVTSFDQYPHEVVHRTSAWCNDGSYVSRSVHNPR